MKRYDSCNTIEGDGCFVKISSIHLWVVVAILALQAVPSTVLASPDGAEYARGEWTDVSRVIAVGDLHGSYEKAVELFQGAALIDQDLHWIGGEQHLVTAGDLLDRGQGDRQLMDLMMRLQQESGAAGGMVHVLLGNHESMNLLRDLRYVSPKSFGAWAEDESEKERKRALRDYLNSQLSSDNRTKRSAEFHRDFPPGFFARQRSLNLDGHYGQWLLSLPAVIKINGVVYVHGGITVETATLGIDGINREVVGNLVTHMKARRVLEKEGFVTPFMGFGEIRQVARAGVKRATEIPAELAQASNQVLDTSSSVYLTGNGPLWYRGTSFEDERIEREMLERALELLGARAMVVAHSPTSSKRITSRFHGKLFKVDHNIGQSDKLQALVVDADDIVVIDASTQLTMMPVEELPIGNHLPRDPLVLSDRDLREVLAAAEIVDWKYLGRGSTRPRLLELEMNGSSQRGIFKSVEIGDGNGGAETTDRYQHEMAAYRLDRALSLDIVPVTVLRTIDGQTGSVQEWVEGAVDQEAALAYDLNLFDSAEITRQLAYGAIFDVLIGNDYRKPGDILCLIGAHRLYFIDHSKAFSTSTDISFDQTATGRVAPSFVDAIKRLDRHSLIQELGELISEDQIDALLTRRDRILEQVEAAATEEAATASAIEIEADGSRP